ncbi:predicted protein [Naegleria gruberi]|uniref:Predicted protein n=1 Tax=Naegleria gruberi TaxID=5762 RepID=D2VUY3_NAEGR|nr:uncharacterized protein NAEGRDRAFT_72827 [Naegleria gruberi]EFC39346.1 predicted protein [Naegleria gruberi]|eukprot:XP_002672090.1 predicted protein [Naegleria gruberi strain NEG-M]
MLPNADLFPLHRIDRLTSGVLILGKSSEVARDFSASLKSKQVGKQYIAVAEGICPTEGLFKVDYPLMEIDPLLGIWRAVHSEESKEFIKKHYLHHTPLDWNNVKEAETLFQVLYRDYASNRTVFLCQPVSFII